jgi:hypothetical protein
MTAIETSVRKRRSFARAIFNKLKPRPSTVRVLNASQYELYMFGQELQKMMDKAEWEYEAVEALGEMRIVVKHRDESESVVEMAQPHFKPLYNSNEFMCECKILPSKTNK